MSQPVLSNVRHTYDGDLNVGRGQLGFGINQFSVAANSDLWLDIYSGANKYDLNPTGANRTIILPKIGSVAGQVQPGHDLWIYNSSDTFDLIVQNSNLVLLNTINPGNSAMYVADPNLTLLWYLNVDTSLYGGNIATLQSAYDASGVTTPQIQLDATFGGLKIWDTAGNLPSLFQLRDGPTSFNYLNVGNSPGGDVNSFVSMNGATASAANTLTSGFVVNNGPNSVVFSGELTVQPNTIPNVFKSYYANGVYHYSGAVEEGTNLTSAANIRTFAADNTVDVTTNSTILLRTLADSTTYDVHVTVTGRDANNTGGASVSHVLKANVSTLGGVTTITGLSVETRETAGVTAINSLATLNAVGLALNLVMNAPDNVVGGNVGSMVVRIVSEFKPLTIGV